MGSFNNARARARGAAPARPAASWEDAFRDQWDFRDVSRRLEAAMDVMGRLPDRDRAFLLGTGSSMPDAVHDRWDHASWRTSTAEPVLIPSAVEISVAEAALAWLLWIDDLVVDAAAAGDLEMEFIDRDL